MTEAELRILVAQKHLSWVGHRGNPNSLIWIVGEAPGADEEQAGLPFVGASGREQDRMLADAGFTHAEGICFTNPYNVRPPENKMSNFESLGLRKSDFEQVFLTSLQQYRPRIIITVGETPTALLCPQVVPKRKGEGFIGKYIGSLLKSPLLAWDHFVIPNWHPAYILRQWNERPVAVLVYQKALEELTFLKQHGCLQPLPSRQIEVLHGDEIVPKLCDFASRNNGKPIAFDIETLRRRMVYTIALASSPSYAIAFKIWQSDYRILRLLQEVFYSCTLIGQNCTVFDVPWLESVGFHIPMDRVEDIMIRHHILWPELKHRLAFTTMQYTREPFYKDDGKSPSGSDLLVYNGKDACVTFEIFLREEEEFKERYETTNLLV